MIYLPYVFMGFLSLLLQITVLRELLTVFSGNELDIGITLSLWLISVGAGSFSGSKITSKSAFGLSFVFVAVLSIQTLIAIKLIRPVLGVEYGEVVSLLSTFLSTALAIFPLCFCLGLQFPLAVSHMGGKSPAGRVYGLEAIGAFAGGALFTFLLSGRLDAPLIILMLGIPCMLLSAYLVGRKALISALIIPVLLFFVFKGIGPALWRSSEAGELVETAQSRYGEIWVTKLEDQYNVYSAGQFLFAYPDSQTEELKAHLSMSVHPSPEDVLLVGGSPGVLREFLKYPIRGIDFIEIDPELIKTSFDLLSKKDAKATEDKRVNIIAEDGRRFVKSLRAPRYDLIVLNLPEPSTANMNRFYTSEFFEEAKSALKEGGMLAAALSASAGYVGRRMQLSNGAIFNSLKSAFAHVETTTEEYGGFFASQSPIDVNPDAIKKRFEGRGVKTAFFHPYVLDDAFMPRRAEFHKGRLDSIEAENTDAKPAAYFYNLMLWAEVHGGGALNSLLELGNYAAYIVLILFASAVPAIIKKRRRTLYNSIFTTGYSGMAFMLAIILGFQSACGYIYEMIGLITALFMAGVFAGTHVARGTVRGLLSIEIGIAALAAVMPSLFLGEAMFHVLSVSAGVLTGCGFKAVSNTIKEEGSGGKLYALDLAGSFSGALLTALVFVPIIGIKGTLLTVAAVKCLSAFAVSFIIRE